MFGNNNFNSFGTQPQQPAQGGLFGGNKPAGGLFGTGTQPQQAPTGGLFGAQTQGAFGQPQQQTNNTFMQPNQQAQGAFGNQPQNTMGGGIFGGQQTQPQGQGLFGATQQPQQTGMFGAQQPQQNTAGLFGGQQQQQQGTGLGLFGGQQQPQQTQAGFGQPQQQATGIFGGAQQQGAGLFGQTQQPQQQTGNLFGGNTQTAGTGLFGNTSTNANSAFLGQQQPQQQQSPFGANPSPFGATTAFGQPQQPQQQAGTNLFGGQQQQQPNAGGLFNTFAPTTTAPQQQQTGMFQQPSQPAGSGNMFGNTAFNPAGTSSNKLGGTSWGVPTQLGTTPSANTVSVGTQVQPVKSKNSKLDAKHLVKCIAALDQFNGLSKEEIRISFIQSGGQQPALNQQQATTGFGTNTAFKPLGTGLGGQTSLPSFGGLTSTNTLAPQTGNSLFGQTQQAQQPAGQNLFGQQAKPAFGQTNPAPAFGTATPSFGQQGTSLFGQQQPAQQGTSLFGGATQPQQGTSMFGQTAATGTTSLFGQTAAQPAGTSLFGAAPAQPAQTSLFGQPAQQTTSLFGQQPAQQTTSLFGQTAQQPSTSLFGATTPSLFGAQPASTSLFGQTTPATTPIGQSPSPFGATQQTPTAQPSFFNQPPSTFSQLSNPLFQGQQMDPNLQMLLPQLLLNYALTQPQVANADSATNPTVDLLSKLTTLVNQLTVNQNQSQNNASATASTPFDDFMREAKTDRLLSQKKETENAYSLFSDFEKQPNYYIQSAAYPSYDYKEKEEPQYTIQSVHKVPKKQESFLSTSSHKQVARGYRATQEEGRKKINAVLADLPKIGSYSISPSLERLKGYTNDQLRSVEHVRIWNQYGQVQFLEPVSLFRADLSASVTLSKDNIEITDPELQDKRMRMTFRNFGNYANLKGEERDKIVKRMRKWIAKYEMKEISHDERSGDLVVEVDN